MPYKSEKIKLKGLQDRRRKLTDDQKEEIRRLYEKGLGSWNSLAKQFGVSKKTIGMIVNPKVMDKNKQYIKDHWKDYQESKYDHAKTIREHRRYKQSLYVKGELKEV